MLQNLRDRLKGVSTLIIILIAIPFVFVGVDSFVSKGPEGDIAATVNDDDITEIELRRALAIEKQRILNQLGDSQAVPDDEQLRHTVQQRLIRETLLSQRARNNGMAVSPVAIADLLKKEPAFQVDGQFNSDRYTFFLRQIGYTPKTYSNFLRSQLLISQLVGGLTGSQFLTDQEASLLAELVEQRRDYQFVVIPSGPAMAEIQVSDADVEAYYRDHQSSFQAEEKVVVEYLEMTAGDIMAQIVVDDAQVRERFDAEVAAQAAAVRRHVAHILIAPTADGSDQAKLAAVQKKLAAGEDFAHLATIYSDDAGSAAQGGDLGFMEPGAFPESFENAANQLEPGQVSPPVATPSGLHLIKLLDIDQKPAPIFANERERIRHELQRQAADELLPAKISELKELAYNAESLADVGKSLDLPLKVSRPFGRAGGEGIAAHPAVLSAAFSDDVLEKGYASELLELGDDRVLVLKLREHQPATVRPLVEVTDQIIARLKHERAQSLLAERAKAIAARVRNGEELRQAGDGLVWQDNKDTKRYGANADPESRERAFDLPPRTGDDPSVVTFAKRNGDHVVLSLTGVRPGSLDELSVSERERLTSAAAGALANRDYQAYLNGLLATAEVSVKTP